ncbi:nuclear transport factor 2 family protein [Nonomuraea aurantiaca]|uniref:nuclear transport factor 2 family protein n=1 Tax=Nonomuraea aurantiaca TaxID=2878562 RepID=UPI003556C7DD
MRPEAETMRDIERQRLRSLVTRDMAAADVLHADDYQLITPRGIALSKEEYLGRYRLWTTSLPGVRGRLGHRRSRQRPVGHFAVPGADRRFRRSWRPSVPYLLAYRLL